MKNCARSFLLFLALFGASAAFAMKGYVPNYNGHDVSVIDTATQTVVATILPWGTGGLPSAAAVTPDGNAYVNSGTLTAAEGQALINAVNALKSDLGC